jgi:hypothetical protein
VQGATGYFNLIQSPSRIGNANAGGYDLNQAGLYFYDGANTLPYIELGDYL